MDEKLIVSPSPHLRGGISTRSIMLDVIIALIPAGAFSVFLFGWRAFLVIAVSVSCSVVFEFLTLVVLKRRQSVGDLSAVVTGLLLAYNLPPTIPLWMAAIGAFVAIVIVKQLFGGIGQNFANPAITARIVLMVSFPAAMTTWLAPNAGTYGAVTTATPLALISSGDLSQLPTAWEMFIGIRGGCIGETSAVFLLLGGLYLMGRRVISPTVPVVFVGTVALLSFLLGRDPLYAVLSGGLLLGAIFMATDYTTSPLTRRGKIIFAVGCGVITTLIRVYASLPEGVSYSILLMNILTPLIERFTAPKPFGRERVKNEK